VSARAEAVRALHRVRPRSRTVRWSTALLATGVVAAWASGEVSVGELFTERRLANLRRFASEDALPAPLAQGGGTRELLAWLAELWTTRGAEATAATLWIALAAIVLAGAVATPLAALGAQSLLRSDPYSPDGPAGRGWRLLVGATRTLCVAMRAIPEYVWAFLLLALLGPTAWAAVTALAVHNAGILGRLGADTLENVDRAAPRALRTLGASRRQLAVTALFPAALGRALLYFFYRLETCVREATVLGMLGTLSLGYWIQDARARMRYDELLLYVALGGALVLVADLVSQVARRWVRGGA
jgi:phosphonate transport system permease protein